MKALAALLGLFAAPDHTLTLETQAGTVARLPVPMTAADEDSFLNDARQWADHRGEAVAVCQGGRLVALVNPR